MGFFVIICRNVFSVRPKTTLLLPLWPRDAERLDSPVPTGSFLGYQWKLLLINVA